MNGIETYSDAMKGMCKITWRLADKSFDELLEDLKSMNLDI